VTTPMNIPLLGQSMTEGTIEQWLITDGALVEEGAPIYLLGTDKVETEICAPQAGTIRLIGEEGESYAVGTRIAEIT
jgi:pyruvate/2-oxoglutarate dehydrogenase complex dihydrolipoamide acyltransferase (E2) component